MHSLWERIQGQLRKAHSILSSYKGIFLFLLVSLCCFFSRSFEGLALACHSGLLLNTYHLTYVSTSRSILLYLIFFKQLTFGEPGWLSWLSDCL